MFSVMSTRARTSLKAKAFAVSLTVCAIGSAIALERALPAPKLRYVLIHSDDAGMYSSVNRATIDAMERGIVSSCSIMVPCPAFEEFALYARSHPEKDFGVHLTLNCDVKSYRWGPVLPRKSVRSLLDPDGYFWEHTEDTVRRAKLEEVEAELRAQINKALRCGIKLSHLDHHMFVLYRRPDFLKLYIRLGIEHGLALRYSEEMPSRQELNRDQPQLVTEYLHGLATLKARNMPFPKSIDTANYDVAPEEKRAYYLQLFHRLPAGVSEILIHCAYGPKGPQHAPSAMRREGDTRFFLSVEAAEALRQNGIKIISWREFRESRALKSVAI
jgi:predicted glycoside hydrolase/deacetylase ChbG (UPF0249 family)